MFAIYKKEIKQFFNTIEGYIAISVFFITTSIVLWYIPSEYNIILNNKASLDPFFQISPWILLILTPSITMKMMSNEIFENTNIILLTKPIKIWEIIVGKFFASFTIGIISILPTIIFIYSIYHLSDPKGNIDVGALVGSYFGLSFLIACYIAIGIFCSSISNNNIISYIYTLTLILLFLLGLDVLADLNNNHLLKQLSIMTHYESISRGVLDTRDLIYFLSLIFLFLTLSSKRFQKNI